MSYYEFCSSIRFNMSWTYYNCRNLTGSPVCGNNVTNMSYTYHSCSNLYGDAYLYNVTNGTTLGTYKSVKN